MPARMLVIDLFTFSDDMGVISVRDVHLHRDSCGLCVQVLHDQSFGLLHTLLCQSPNPDVWVFLGLGSNFKP